METNSTKEKRVVEVVEQDEEDEDKENLAAENLFGDPEVRGDEDEDNKEEPQAVVSFIKSIVKFTTVHIRNQSYLFR